MKLWIDSRRPAPKGWVWARNYAQARRLLEEYDWDFDIISLNHDLGEEKTGYDLLCEIEARANDYVHYAPFVGVHTADMTVQGKMRIIASRLNGKRLRGKR